MKKKLERNQKILKLSIRLIDGGRPHTYVLPPSVNLFLNSKYIITRFLRNTHDLL